MSETMNSVLLDSATIGVVISILGYGLGIWLKGKFKLGLFNPLLVAIAFVMILVGVLGIDYDSYNASAKYLSYLLTPATVSLAIPMYMQIERLKKTIVAILAGCIAGALSSMGTILALSIVFGLSHEQYVTLLPKSITTAIGMGVSEELNGYVTITVAVIIITGILGNVLGDLILKIARVTDPVAKGLALGSASHAIGTAHALELGEIEGAMSSLAVVVSGILTVIGASIFAGLY